MVLISGGPDSACAAAALARALGPEHVHALHVNYGLRDAADRDERACRDLCSLLRIDLHVERPDVLQATSRPPPGTPLLGRRAAPRPRRGDWIATGHSRTDLAETVVYRLAASPGARGLRCLPAQSGRVVRPLLGLERADTRRLATAAGLPFADDETNLDPAFARNRIRAEICRCFGT